MNVDYTTFTLVQNTALDHINSAIDLVKNYTTHLLYFLAVLEISATGILWSWQHDATWGRLFLKILQISLIIYFINNYAWILDIIFKSFIEIGKTTVKNDKLTQLVLNPAHIWQYGYNVSLNLLKTAALGSSLGLILIQIILGFGILLVFGLLGIQSVLQLVGFYMVSLFALLLLPFGAFTPTISIFEHAVRSVFQAGVRVMAIIIVVGLAALVFAENNTYENIGQLLGLFFTGLLFLCLAIRLPQILASAVGKVKNNL